MPPKTIKPYTRRFLKTKAEREADNAAIRSTLTKRKSPTPPPPSPPPPPPDNSEPPATTATATPVQPLALPPLPNPTPSAPALIDTSGAPGPRTSSAAPAGSASPPNNQVDLPPPIDPISLQPDCSVHDSSPPTPSSQPTDSTTDSTAATSTRAHSIRCKDFVIDTAISGAPPKRKRGVVVAKKTKDTFRLTGAKIKVEWDDVHNVPANKEIASQMSRDIGMKVKDDVPMVASVYGDLPKEAKRIVYTFMTTFYGIDVEHDGQFNWIQEVAASRYKDWKHDCRRHWEKHRQEVPVEFLKRPREWESLCKEFSSDENKRLSQKMKAARVAPTRMNHHSGTTAFVYRAQEHALAGHAAPFVATFKDVYGKDKIGATHVEAMERDVEEKLNELSAEHPDCEDRESLPLETQISVITTRIGEGKGTTYRGLGKSIRREPKKRGGVSRVDVDAMVEERVAERVNAVEEKVQEQLRKQEEQHQQQMKKQEEQLKDQMKTIVQQQLDAAVAQAINKFMEAQQRQLQEGTPSNVNPSSDT